MGRVKDKVVLVTGGASGIGKAACILLAQEGAKVAVIDINDVGGTKTVDYINQCGGVAKFWHLDTSDESEVEKIVESVVETFGRIDGLVNNAGVAGQFTPTHKASEKDYKFIMSVNVKGVFFCTKHVIPHMLNKGGGSIVNISSVAGLVGMMAHPLYSASKGAVRLMTKADALTYAKEKIRVNSIHPGFIETPILQPFISSRPDVKEALTALVPLGRLGKSIEIAYGILYLISDESSFITGSELVIDGGLTAQ